MAAGGYSVTITATDRATKTIDDINKRLAAIRAPTERLHASLTKFGRLSGISDLARHFGNMGRSALGAFSAISKIIAPLGVLTGAASLAGAYRLSESFAAWAQHLALVSMRVGIAVPALQQLQGVARLTGASAGDLDTALVSLRDSLKMIATGGGNASPEQIRYFNMLGISANAASEMLGHMDTALPLIKEKLAAIHDPTLRAIVGTSLLGASYERLTGYMNASKEEIDDYNERVSHHFIATEQQIKDGRRLQVSFTDLGLAAEGMGNQIAAVTAGPMMHMLDFFTHLIDANRDVIAARIGYWAKQLDNYLSGLDWTAIGHRVDSFVTSAVGLATALGGIIAWLDKMNLLGPVVGLMLVAKLLGPMNLIGAALAAWRIPAAMAALLGLPAEGVLAAAAATGAAGAYAGAKGVAMVDDQGNVVGNWGGAEGEAQARHQGMREAGDRDNDPNYARQPFVPLGSRIWQWATGGGGAANEGRASVYPGAGSQGGDGARNLRNNNPTNLTFAGQPGAVSDGRFARFPNMETGVAADLNQLLRYNTKWHATSIEDMLHIATPKSDNNPGIESYIDRVSAAMGMKRTDSPDLHNRDIARRFIMAIAPNEGGTPNAGAVQRGVDLRLGTTPPAASGPPGIVPSAPGGTPGNSPPPSGTATLRVIHENPPAGSKVVASTEGTIFNGAPRIERSMPAMAMP